MRRRVLASLLFSLILVTMATSQPPPEGKDKLPPRLEPGKILLPQLRQTLDLSAEQLEKLQAIEKDAYEQLLKILTKEQQKRLQELPTRGPMPQDGFNKKEMKKRPPATVQDLPQPEWPPGPRIVNPARLEWLAVQGQQRFQLSGDAMEGEMGDWKTEHSGRGVKLLSGEDVNRDGKSAGAVHWMVQGISPAKGRWYRLRAEVLVQETFSTPQGETYLEVEFFRNRTDSLDRIQKPLMSQFQRDRRDLADPAMNKRFQGATWRQVQMEFRTPFPEIDTFRLGVAFVGGVGKKEAAELWVREIELVPIPDPKDYIPPLKAQSGTPAALKELVKLGGRWYYDPRGGASEVPKQFDYTNVDRLIYFAGRLERPFVGNVSAWRRRGYLDREGKVIDKDEWIADAVTLTFTQQHLVIRSRNLPNHPTGVFPDGRRFFDGNPNAIQEQNHTWYIPLEPKENPEHVAMNARNENGALPMGHIGVMVNGVVFNNPFDESNEIEAIWRLDRCCGHPSPMQDYHYHKYPVCTNTAWADDGEDHSPLIGFAIDGFPVYGPYEAKGEMARNSQKNPLSAFNGHTDESRGFHYHVTPGRSPHIIGGFWGEVDARNQRKKGKKN